MRSKWIMLGLLLWLSPAHALTLEEPLQDSAEEARARAIFYELRCVVCQGESIADSGAQVAVDMRREVRTQIVAGKPASDILAYFVDRYGDSILMKPPVTRNTVALWFMPLVFLLLGAAVCLRYFRLQRSRN